MNASLFKNDGGTHVTHHCHAAEKLKVKLLDLKRSEMQSCTSFASIKQGHKPKKDADLSDGLEFYSTRLYRST